MNAPDRRRDAIDSGTRGLPKTNRIIADKDRAPSSDLNSRGRGNEFDEDELGELCADGEAGVANLADEIGLAGEETNHLIFPEAEFAQAILQLRRGAELFNADGDAGAHAAQGTEFAPGFFGHCKCLSNVHVEILAAEAKSDYTDFAKGRA